MKLIIGLIFLIINLYEIILFVRFIIEIFKLLSPKPFSQFMTTIYGFLFNITEPLIIWIKKYIPTTFQNIDFSYLIIILALEIIKKILLLIF